ncbi:hypothetical protein, partial [Pseudomonas sp. G5001]|uniref:hypothetical protein n=1 Tax=Pseudomonas sp. G5001 TaxID=2738824 RepID=UPI001C43049B
ALTAAHFWSVVKQNQKLKRARFKCGSWLACDGIASVYLKNRVVCIAGKPAPTEKQTTECGHAEPRRGTEWWGKDLLVTFGWAGIPGVCQK